MRMPSSSDRSLRRFCLLPLAYMLALAPLSLTAANILFVVSSPSAPIGNDPEVIDRLTTLKGHTVDLVDDDDATLATKDLSPYALVLISSSVGSGGAGVNPLCKNLATGRTPVICYEPGDYDELLMQTATTFGNAGGHTSITISTNFTSHPLAAGKRGTISIVEEGSTATLSYRPDAAIPGGEPILISFNANVDVGRLNLWAYEKGSRLADNTTVATSRRVATFFNATTAAGVYNTNAWDLFDASLTWALQAPPNLPITASLRSPTAQNAAANASIVVDLDDGTSTQAVTNSISLSLNGTSVAPSISRSGKITTVSFTPAGLLPSSSSNTVRIVYTDTGTPAKTSTNTFAFIVANYVSIPAAQRITGTPTASAPGFAMRVVQGPANPPTFINSAARAEAQLANRWIDRNTGLPFPNEATPGPVTGGFYNVATMINFDQVPGNQGNFTSANGFPEVAIPGIPGTTGHMANHAAEILTYLDLAAGYYTLGVNSDDGFVLYTGPDARDMLASSVGRFDGGRGAADTTFGFNVEAAGVYSFRLLWYQGDGGSNIEFFSIDGQTGQKILINAAGNAKAIKAWRQVTGTRPYIRSVSPFPDATAVDVNGAVTFTLADGDAQVATNTIRLTFDGTTVTPTVAKTGGQTTVSYDPPGVMLNFSRHTAQLTYGDNGTPAFSRTASLTFQTGAGSALLQNAAGLVVWEAEDYDTNIVSVTHEWIPQASPAGYSGRTAMYASPDAPGAVIETPDGFVTSPRLSYRINFVKTGTHYFWFRGSDGGGNSINAGIDDVDPSGTTMANIDDFAACCGTRLVPGGTSFVWVGGTDATPAGRASFEVPTVGVHTIHIWMREDGQIIDKLLVTTDANFVPTGAGPEASARVGQTPPTVSITGPTANQTFAANSNVPITVNAADSDGTVAKVEFFADANLIGERTTAPFSFTWTSVPSGRYVLSARATDNTGINARSANVEIVVGTPPPEALFLTGTPTASDQALMARLGELGFVVRAVLDAASQTSDANNKALIVISSSVGSGNIATKFTASPVPLINWESAVYDDLGMELNNAAGATIATQTTIEIVDASHPLAAGLGAGIKTVYVAAGDISTLTDVVPSAKVVARATDGTARPVLFAIEKGAAMNTARIATAPERRVGIFLANDTYVTATADGKKLFDAAVSWATGGKSPGPQPKFNPPTLSANGVTISWTGAGTLEQTASLSSPAWAAAPSQANPQTVAASGTRFYRIRP